MMFKFGGNPGLAVNANRRVPIAVTRLITKLDATEFGTLWTGREVAAMAQLGMSAFSHARGEPELVSRRARDLVGAGRLVYGSPRTIAAYLKRYPTCRYKERR
jgi:hypothetical protein